MSILPVHRKASSASTIDNCNFNNNYADYGGAVYFSSSGTVENCNFTNNKATNANGNGGAIYMNSGNVLNCNFTNNSAKNIGGAIYIYMLVHLVLKQMVI